MRARIPERVAAVVIGVDAKLPLPRFVAGKRVDDVHVAGRVHIPVFGKERQIVHIGLDADDPTLIADKLRRQDRENPHMRADVDQRVTRAEQAEEQTAQFFFIKLADLKLL